MEETKEVELVAKKYLALKISVVVLIAFLLISPLVLYLILFQNNNSAKGINSNIYANTKEQKEAGINSTNSVKEVKHFSLLNAFKYTDPLKENIKSESKDEYTIIASGDVLTARSVNVKVISLNNYNYPFEKTESVLKSADAVLINLETPLTLDCKPNPNGMIFCGDAKNIQGLKFANVSIANIANNHAANFGQKGINETINLLKENNIQVAGIASQSAVITIKDKKFGFLGYNQIGGKQNDVAWADINEITKDIKVLKKQVDFIIVTFHWGVEYTEVPQVSQIELAHQTIDAGADLIIGNHPHWVQGVEEYKGKLITYAHGNFVFDQMWSQETKEGILGKYIFNSQGLAEVKFLPVIMDNNLQTRFANENEANKILLTLENSTKQIKEKSTNIENSR